MRYASLFLTIFLFPLHCAPIDVVIPCIEKDLPVLDYAIQGIKLHGKEIRHVYIVSPEKLTENGIWFPESRYPFSMEDIKEQMVMLPYDYDRTGWYFQQLLKLYAPFVIPNLSENFLLLDADTVFYKPVQFVDSEGRLILTCSREYHKAYFRHMDRFLPGLKRMDPYRSGIASHMIVNQKLLKDLFQRIENYHGMPFWQAFIRCVDPKEYRLSGASEYEILFNFCLRYHRDRVKVRMLRFRKQRVLRNLDPTEESNFDFISFHSWMRMN